MGMFMNKIHPWTFKDYMDYQYNTQLQFFKNVIDICWGSMDVIFATF